MPDGIGVWSIEVIGELLQEKKILLSSSSVAYSVVFYISAASPAPESCGACWSAAPSSSSSAQHTSWELCSRAPLVRHLPVNSFPWLLSIRFLTIYRHFLSFSSYALFNKDWISDQPRFRGQEVLGACWGCGSGDPALFLTLYLNTSGNDCSRLYCIICAIVFYIVSAISISLYFVSY